jgi:hypothetical protein
MPYEDDVNNYYKIQLETTRDNSKGVGFKLIEETGKNLPGYFNLGKMKWRVK